MKKVITHGCINEIKIYQGNCDACKCVFEYDGDELMPTNTSTYLVSCPDCGEYIEHEGLKEPIRIEKDFK